MTVENYTNLYNSLIQHRKCCQIITNKRDKRYIYHEQHHILPRSLGGTDDSNLVNLYAFEHFLAHKMLMHIYANTKYENCMAYAFLQMSYMLKPNSYCPNKSSFNFQIEREYAAKIISKHLSGRIRINKNGKMKYVKPEDLNQFLEAGYKIGALKLSTEHRNNISRGNRGKKHRVTKRRSSLYYVELSRKLKGKQKHNKGKIRISNGVQEKYISITEKIPNGWYKGRSDKFKKRMQLPRCKRTPEQRKRISDSHRGIPSHNKGTMCITNGLQNRYIQKTDTIPSGWHIGGKPIHKR